MNNLHAVIIMTLKKQLDDVRNSIEKVNATLQIAIQYPETILATDFKYYAHRLSAMHEAEYRIQGLINSFVELVKSEIDEQKGGDQCSTGE